MATYMPGGRSIAAGRVWDWIAAGWELFKRQVWMWMALALVALVIFVAPEFIQHIPFIGEIASFIVTTASIVLMPVFGAGIVIASRAIEEGRELEIAHLFAGFKKKIGPLATVGATCLGAVFVTPFMVGLVTGASLQPILDGRTPSAGHHSARRGDEGVRS